MSRGDRWLESAEYDAWRLGQQAREFWGEEDDYRDPRSGLSWEDMYGSPEDRRGWDPEDDGAVDEEDDGEAGESEDCDSGGGAS